MSGGARVPGALPYGLFVVLLLAGGGWWLAAAPDRAPAPEVAAWRATVLRKLPESENRTAGMVTLEPGEEREETTPVRGGSFLVSVVCAGPGRVRVSLSTSGTDSGRGLECAAEPDPITFRTGLSDELHLRVSADDAGPAVVRWALQRLTA